MNEVQKLNQEIENLLKRIAVLTNTAAKDALELSKAKTRIAELEAELAKAQKNSDEQDELIGDKDGRLVLASFRSDAANAKIAELETGLATSNARIAELEPALATSNARVAELETGLAAENADLRAQLAAAHAAGAAGAAENSDLRAQLAAAHAAGAAPVGAAVVIDVETREENANLQKLNSKLRGDLGVEKTLVSTLRTQLHGTKRKLEALEKPADDDDEVEYMGTTSVKSAETKEIGDDDENNGAAGAP